MELYLKYNKNKERKKKKKQINCK